MNRIEEMRSGKMCLFVGGELNGQRRVVSYGQRDWHTRKFRRVALRIEDPPPEKVVKPYDVEHYRLEKLMFGNEEYDLMVLEELTLDKAVDMLIEMGMGIPKPQGSSVENRLVNTVKDEFDMAEWLAD